jgi:hypothetical protein
VTSRRGSGKGSGKVRRTERYRYLLDDPTAAAEELTAARFAELRARGTDRHEQAAERLEAAEAAVDACYGTVVLRALRPAVHQVFAQETAERDAAWEQVVKAAQKAEQEAPEQPEPTWAEESFEVRLIADCDDDPTHTAAWWAAEFAGDEWAPYERDELLQLALSVNAPKRSFDLGVLGKG